MALAKALQEAKTLYQELTGQSAPDLGPEHCLSFPLGIDPFQRAVEEVGELRQLAQQLQVGRPVSWVPPADCLAAEDAHVIRVEIPGVSREDLEVFVTGGECVVRGERKPPEEKLRPLAVERPWGVFERRFFLPLGCRGDAIRGRCQDGILELRVPRAPESSGKRTAVDVE